MNLGGLLALERLPPYVGYTVGRFYKPALLFCKQSEEKR